MRKVQRRIDAVFERAGTTDSFSRSVADVLDGAIVRAETERHEALETSLAPVVVKTVKTEIVNSQDALVEALYPMTGQMVKAYVASAMRDLVKQVNRRLESNRLMLRIKSLTSGRSMAELALAESQRVEVEDLLLIRRGTGELVARWPDSPGTRNQDHVLGGVLTAINSFATEALQTNENALREIDLGEKQVYLRGSPGYLLAAKCAGTAGASIEQVIDDEFLKTVSGLHGERENPELARSSLSSLGPRLTERISRQYEELDAPALGISPAKLLAAVILLPAIAWFAWSTWINYETNRVQAIAKEVIENSAEIRGYPTTLHVAPRGRAMTITGLAPNTAALQAVLGRLAEALPATAINNRISVVPQGARDAAPEIAALRRELGTFNRESWRRSTLGALDNARQGLSAATAYLEKLKALAASGGRAEITTTVKKLAPALAAAALSLGDAGKEIGEDLPAGAAAEKLAARLNGQADALHAAITAIERENDLAAAVPSSSTVPALPPPADQPAYVTSAESLADQARRAQLITLALLQSEITLRSIPKPAPAPTHIPTPIEQLSSFVKTNAIFFGENAEFRDTVVANAQLDELAKLLGKAGVFLRVVGYTDERGTTTRNSTLSQRRAERVRDELVERGIPASNLIAVGRLSMIDISPATGPTSANRRVEFEIGFKGEGSP